MVCVVVMAWFVLWLWLGLHWWLWLGLCCGYGLGCTGGCGLDCVVVMARTALVVVVWTALVAVVWTVLWLRLVLCCSYGSDCTGGCGSDCILVTGSCPWKSSVLGHKDLDPHGSLCPIQTPTSTPGAAPHTQKLFWWISSTQEPQTPCNTKPGWGELLNPT